VNSADCETPRKKRLSKTFDSGPEWADARDIRQLLGIRQTLLYEWHYANLIRSVSIKKPGRVKGKRLFHVQSVRDFIESQQESQPTTGSN
jgi:hypothetical protein